MAILVDLRAYKVGGNIGYLSRVTNKREVH